MLLPLYSKVLLESTSSTDHIITFKGAFSSYDHNHMWLNDGRCPLFVWLYLCVHLQPRCWRVDAMLLTSHWQALRQQELKAPWSSASGSWSRTSPPATYSVSAPAEVQRLTMTSKRPSAVSALVIGERTNCYMHTTSPCPVGGTTLKTLNSKKTKVCTLAMTFQLLTTKKKLKSMFRDLGWQGSPLDKLGTNSWFRWVRLDSLESWVWSSIVSKELLFPDNHIAHNATLLLINP